MFPVLFTGKMCLVSKYPRLTISTEVMIAALYSFHSYFKEQFCDIDRKRVKEKKNGESDNKVLCCLCQLICIVG